MFAHSGLARHKHFLTDIYCYVDSLNAPDVVCVILSHQQNCSKTSFMRSVDINDTCKSPALLSNMFVVAVVYCFIVTQGN